MYCDMCIEKYEAFGEEAPCKSCYLYHDGLVALEKKRPTFSRFPYQTPVEQICDFCANDIPCSQCEFGV